MPLDSSLLDALHAVQQDVLQTLVAGQSIHLRRRQNRRHSSLRLLSGVHNWTRHHLDFARARALLDARHSRAERMLDELGDLADLALDTFRQLLSDEKAPASA